jgi:MFS family permease
MSDEQSAPPAENLSEGSPSLAHRIGAGLVGGVCYAAALSVIAVVVSSARRPQGGDSLDLGAVIGGYFLGGVLGGLIAGAVWPLVTSRTRATLLAIVAALPMSKVLTAVVDKSPTADGQSNWFIVVLVAVLMGLILGKHLWDYKRGLI